MKKSVFPLMFLSLLMGVDWNLRAGEAEPKTNKGGAASKIAAGIVISKETTFVEGPLNKQGFVNYTRAIDEKARLGLTTENNAAVLLSQALGPDAGEMALDANYRERYFKALGIEIPAADGDYFVSIRRLCLPHGS